MRANSVSFASFNLLNLQLPGRTMYHGNTYTQQVYDAKKDWTARTLQTLNADVIGFQELWSPAALVEAFEAAGLDDDYTLVLNSDPDPSQISVALAVKKPHTVTFRRWVKDFPPELKLVKRGGAANEPDYQVSVGIDRFSREVLRATISLKPDDSDDLPPISVFVAHFKSKLPMRLDSQEWNDADVRPHQTAIGAALSTVRRTAECAALRVMLNKVMRGSNTPVVVLGDLNANQRSVEVSILTGQPKFKLFAKQRTTGADKGLYATAAMQQFRSERDVYYTHLFNGERESLDHILVSEEFYDYSSDHVWTFREMRIINDHLDDEHGSGSDHGVALAKFDYNPA